MIFALGEHLEMISQEDAAQRDIPAVYLTQSEYWRETLEAAGVIYEGELRMSQIEFCKVETGQECLYGSFSIPKLRDVLGNKYQVAFFINQRNIVIIDDSDFSRRLIERLQKRKVHQGETKEQFIYNFVSEFMAGDLEFLVEYEKRIMDMEEELSKGCTEHFQKALVPIRKELLTLRSYYDELSDLGEELEDNENGFFQKRHLKYFGTITNRADRLKGKTIHLLDYAQQMRDVYQAQVDAIQNSNMQFLTVVSSIFLPLTLITGWYGMNFKNMPELENGYPGVIIVSIIVIIVCLIIFKKKKII